MNHQQASVLEVGRSRPLSFTRVVTESLREPGPGQIALKGEAFGLSSNNVTYALLGDVLGHWRPFPAEAGWGRVPAWGVARVTGGDPTLAPVGARLVGYLPMATQFLLTGTPTATGLDVTSPERAEMLPMYRRMRRIDSDPTWYEDFVGVEVQLLPIVPPAALLSWDLLNLEPSQVVISSASSKTSLALGRMLRTDGTRTIGITGAARAVDVAATGAFDEVVAYDRIRTVRGVKGTVYVDISGDPAITLAAHAHFGPALSHSVAVGGSHRAAADGAVPPAVDLPGPAPVRFHVGQREIDLTVELGEAAVQRRIAETRAALVSWAATWLPLEVTTGLDEAQEAWRRVARGDLLGLTAVVVRP